MREKGREENSFDACSPGDRGRAPLRLMGEIRKNYLYIIFGKGDELLPSLDASDVQEVNAQSTLTETQQQTA